MWGWVWYGMVVVSVARGGEQGSSPQVRRKTPPRQSPTSAQSVRARCGTCAAKVAVPYLAMTIPGDMIHRTMSPGSYGQGTEAGRRGEDAIPSETERHGYQVPAQPDRSTGGSPVLPRRSEMDTKHQRTPTRSSRRVAIPSRKGGTWTPNACEHTPWPRGRKLPNNTLGPSE